MNNQSEICCKCCREEENEEEEQMEKMKAFLVAINGFISAVLACYHL